MNDNVHPQFPSRETIAKLRYCYVRFQGLMRCPAIKVLYTDDTMMSSFIAACLKQGNIRSVEFPKTLRPLTSEEIATAFRDGRIVL